MSLYNTEISRGSLIPLESKLIAKLLVPEPVTATCKQSIKAVYKTEAANFKDIAIELWEVKNYSNGTVAVQELKKSISAESIKPRTQQSQEFKQVADQVQVQVYTEDHHLLDASPEITELYEKFRNSILNLADSIKLVPQKHYIAFKKHKSYIACLKFQKKQIKIWIEAKVGKLDDPKKLAIDVSSIGHYGTEDYEWHVENASYLEYITSLVKQVI